MTRYFVEVDVELNVPALRVPEGFRFCSIVERGRHADWWSVEDDGAPPELEGQLVVPVFQVTDDEAVKIVDRLPCNCP